MRDRDQRIERRGRELVELVSRRLPQEIEVTGDADAWPAVSLSLLSRMAGTVEAILDLEPRGREADAATLARSLYEHAVHFAWLAAEPTASRLQEWGRYDIEQRLKADTDMRRYGQPLFTDETRAELEARFTRLVGKNLILEQLANAADRFWTPRIPGLVARSTFSFAGLYASLYRFYSATAHPTMLGLNRVTDDINLTRKRIRLEREYQGAGPYGMATVVFGLALQVAARTLGWPSPQEIEAVFERYGS